MSIKSFPDYKHLLTENYMEYKHNFFYHYLSYFLKKEPSWVELHFENIPCSFLVIHVCNQGKTLCSPCITLATKTFTYTFYCHTSCKHLGFHNVHSYWMYLQYGLWIGLMMAQWAESCCQIYKLIINYLLCSDWIK